MLALLVRLLGGMWALRRRVRNARRPVMRKVLNSIYSRYMETHGAFIPVEADVDDSVIFPHKPKGVFISPDARVGPRCVIYQQVTIGENRPALGGKLAAPTIGCDVFIGAGAKIIGGVAVGDEAKIGANAVVVKDVPAGATAIAPAATIR